MSPAEIITALEGASGPDRKLDAHIWGLVDDRPLVDLGADRFSKRDPEDAIAFDLPPLYTSSLDACIELIERVLPEAHWHVQTVERRADGLYLAQVWTGFKVNAREATAKSAPIAFLTALFRALEAQRPEGDVK